MNTLLVTPLLAAVVASPAPAQPKAEDHSVHRGGAVDSAPADMTEGEIRKVDKEAKKITIKHGEIKNLAMPPMTMVFQVKDAGLLTKLKPGDQVRFTVEQTAAGTLLVTAIQSAK